jgi:hypothetical protein
METVCFSETLVSKYGYTRRYNPEEHCHIHRRENLKSHCFSSSTNHVFFQTYVTDYAKINDANVIMRSLHKVHTQNE